jgi:hypothetical protein
METDIMEIMGMVIMTSTLMSLITSGNKAAKRNKRRGEEK